MDEIVDELRERNEPVPVPLELPEDDDIVLVEEQILISVPAEFRAFLLEVSDVVYGALEPVTVADPSSHTYLPEVAATAWSMGFPREMIPLCEIPGGYYGVTQDQDVVVWRNGTLEEETWNSVWDWVREIWLEC